MTAASVSDNTGGIRLLSQIAAAAPRVTKAWADTRHRLPDRNPSPTAPASASTSKPSNAPPGVEGFTVIPRRWVVESTYDWLMHHRCLARDYETHPHRSEAIIHVAMIDLTIRRRTSESTANWRDT